MLFLVCGCKGRNFFITHQIFLHLFSNYFQLTLIYSRLCFDIFAGTAGVFHPLYEKSPVCGPLCTFQSCCNESILGVFVVILFVFVYFCVVLFNEMQLRLTVSAIAYPIPAAAFIYNNV